MKILRLALTLFSLTPVFTGNAQTPIRVAIVGLVHGHVRRLLTSLPESPYAHLVAIVEPDKALAARYRDQYHLDESLFYEDMEGMLSHQHPDAVLVFTTIKDHRRVIEAAARHGVSSMVEKPLSTTLDDALAIRSIARAKHVNVLVNYETTWYPSNIAVLRLADSGALGTVHKAIVHDGNAGPAGIGVGPEWFPWLTDPKLNGAGALFDFGCYGADLLTVLMHGKAPISVTAVSQTHQLKIYPHVDDDSTVILRYLGLQAVLMPSWNWIFSRKDMELYGTTGTASTVGPSSIRTRYVGQDEETLSSPAPLATGQSSSLEYLAAVLHGEIKPTGDLSALDTNVIVMQILSAARASAATGRTIALRPLPR
jgi:glucose-fructose oxidoreductase